MCKINLSGFVSQIQAVLMGSAKANRKITRLADTEACQLLAG